MKKIFLTIAFAALFLMAGCQQVSKTSQPINNQANSNLNVQVTDPKTKCQNSGGTWWNPCETGECFVCDCNLGNVRGGSNENHKLLINGECVACTSDEQCGSSKSCVIARGNCTEIVQRCDGGVCKQEKVDFGSATATSCWNNACTPINEIVKNMADGPEKNCLLGGGKWKSLKNTCGDDCYDKTQGYPICGQAFTWKCDCGDNQCWNGQKCVDD